jgi:hypothetical protein
MAETTRIAAVDVSVVMRPTLGPSCQRATRVLTREHDPEKACLGREPEWEPDFG